MRKKNLEEFWLTITNNIFFLENYFEVEKTKNVHYNSIIHYTYLIFNRFSL